MPIKSLLLFISFLVALEAQAIDCSKASTSIEKAICSNETLLSDDKKLTALFNNAKKTTKYPSNVIRSQLQWIAMRNDYCNKAKDINQCITTHTVDRIKDFSASPEAATARPLIRVLGTLYGQGDVGIYNFSYLLFQPADTPQKIAFNELQELNLNPGTKPLNKPPKNPEASSNCEQNTQDSSTSILFLSGKYIATYTSDYSMGCGAAHGNHNSSIQHFNLEAGKALVVSDIFNKKTMEPLINKCIESIADQRGETEVEYRNNYGGSVTGTFNTLNAWSFGNEGATIEFAPYVAASYAEGFLNCEFTKQEIEPLLTENFIRLLSNRQDVRKGLE